MGFHKCRVGYVWSGLVALCLTFLTPFWQLRIESIPPVLNTSNVTPLKGQVVEDTIQKDRTLVATLVDYNIPVTIAQDIATLIKPVFDVRQLRFGNPFKIEKALDGSLKKFEYKIDDERILKVHKETDSFAATVEKLDFDQRQGVITAEINSSLWEALGNQPRGEVLVNSVAQMFAWDVDFNTDIQRGAKIRMIVDQQFHDGKFVKYGKIQAAELVNNGHTYHAYLFKDEYYDDKGNAVRRPMLRSPLQFNPRITSGFSRARLHPILGGVRAHLAVDFGAPTGAPVVAVANGTIQSAGVSGGYGNLVEIKHNNGLVTGYAHLSKIGAGIHRGVAVKQGDVIGLVGATGLATGPHLHYMMFRNGKVINPLTIKSEPPTPIAPGLKSQYFEHITGLQGQLQNLVAQK